MFFFYFFFFWFQMRKDIEIKESLRFCLGSLMLGKTTRVHLAMKSRLCFSHCGACICGAWGSISAPWSGEEVLVMLLSSMDQDASDPVGSSLNLRSPQGFKWMP